MSDEDYQRGRRDEWLGRQREANIAYWESRVVEAALAWHQVFGADLGADKLFAFRDACDALLAAKVSLHANETSIESRSVKEGCSC